MKTIKEIANICNMSKTSVNRAIAELEIKKVLSGNKNFVTDEDADRIVSLLRGFGKTCAENQNESNQNESKTEQNETNNSFSSSSVSIESSKNNDFLVDFLMEQIKVKDNQIAELQEENKLLIQAQAFTVKQLENFVTPEKITEKSASSSEESKENNAEENPGFSQKKKRFFFRKNK